MSKATPQERRLRFAVQDRDVGLVTMLVKDGVNVNAPMEGGATAFQRACQLGFPEILKSLMKAQGLDVNNFFSDGSTPLMVASSLGFTEAVRVLGKAGAEPNTVVVKAESDGTLTKHTAMLAACGRGHFKVNHQTQTLNPKP